MTVRREESGHQDAIRHIVREAFASEEEAVLVDRLRADGHVLLSLVAEVDGIAVGHILFPRMWIVTASGRHNTVALAPLAVLPSHQRSGVGSALVREGLRQLQAMGERAVLVLGHADYYPRFGFSRDCITTLESPFPRESFFGLELTPGALRGISGRVEYPPAFGL